MSMMGNVLPVILKLPVGVGMRKTNKEEVTLFPSIHCRLRYGETIGDAVVSVYSNHRSA